jgi:hypothetical protein
MDADIDGQRSINEYADEGYMDTWWLNTAICLAEAAIFLWLMRLSSSHVVWVGVLLGVSPVIQWLWQGWYGQKHYREQARIMVELGYRYSEGMWMRYSKQRRP